MPVQISIIGMGQIGTSIGLALASQKENIRRVGNDREATIAHRAEKLGAIDKVVFNLPTLVREADVVILDIPVDEILETLKVIALDLKEGAVILDTSTVKNGVLAWASEVLLPGRHLVSWTPAMNPSYIQETAVGIEAAHADLFQNSLIFITHAQGIDAEVVKLAADVATLVGGKPFFADPFEVDGLMAASHILPQLVAAALLGSLLAQPGWDENRKLSGRNLIEATAPLTHLDESTHLGQSALLNGDNVVRVLDDLINSLYELREAIAHKDGNKVQSALEKAVSGRAEWLLQRQAGNWTAERQIQPELPSSAQKLGQLIGFGRRKSPKTDK